MITDNALQRYPFIEDDASGEVITVATDRSMTKADNNTLDYKTLLSLCWVLSFIAGAATKQKYRRLLYWTVSLFCSYHFIQSVYVYI